MLLPYEYESHTIEKLQTYLQHTVFEVWCRADGDFNIESLHPDFRPIVEEISRNKNDYLLTPIQEIYEICRTMTAPQRLLLAQAFRKNNNIRGLCEGTIRPVLYDELAQFNTGLVAHLKKFCTNLYSHVLGLQPFYSRCGAIDDHYDKFVFKNNHGKCPFCGISDIMSENLQARDAYDHYLPKNDYPFNTVNLRNLVPACKTCNTSFKLAYDPIQNGTRKAFYPFAEPNSYTIAITIRIDYLDYENPKHNRVDLNYYCPGMDEQVTTWRDIYKIDSVYADKCRSADSKYWIYQVLEEFTNYRHFTLFGQQISSADCMDMYLRSRRQNPMHEYNFLKVPFLESCMAIGFFE